MADCIRSTAIVGLLSLFGALVVITLVIASGSAPRAHALTNYDGGNPSLDSQESAFLGLINAYRSENGVGSLSTTTSLNRASAWMVHDLGTNAYFSHTDSLGRSPSARARDCGYPSGAGENLAAGTVWDHGPRGVRRLEGLPRPQLQHAELVLHCDRHRPGAGIRLSVRLVLGHQLRPRDRG